MTPEEIELRTPHLTIRGQAWGPADGTPCLALHVPGLVSGRAQLLHDVVGDRLHLGLGIARAEDERVRRGGQLPQVQDDDLSGFLL